MNLNDRTQRHPRVQRAQVPVVRQLGGSGAWVRRIAPDRDVGVLGHVEAGEAGRFRRRGSVGGGDPAIAAEQYDAVPHALLP